MFPGFAVKWNCHMTQEATAPGDYVSWTQTLIADIPPLFGWRNEAFYCSPVPRLTFDPLNWWPQAPTSWQATVNSAHQLSRLDCGHEGPTITPKALRLDSVRCADILAVWSRVSPITGAVVRAEGWRLCSFISGHIQMQWRSKSNITKQMWQD